MSAPSYSAAPASSGYRLRPVQLGSLAHPESVSPSPPPSSTFSAEAVTPRSARMHTVPTHVTGQDPHALPSLSLSPNNPNAPPRPWSPSSGVREIDAAPPPRRTNLPPPPTGHELMALFPTPSPSSPPTYTAPPNSASGSAPQTPGAPVPIPIPTSSWFINEERRFFAKGGKEIVRLNKEEIFGHSPGGSGSNGTKRGREDEREGGSVKRSPQASSSAPQVVPPQAVPSSSYISHPPPTPPSQPPSHSRSQSTSQPFLTLNQANTSYRQPPPPPPRDREPVREVARDADGDVHMGGPPIGLRFPPQVNLPYPHARQRGSYQSGPPASQNSHSSPPAPLPHREHGHSHARAPSYEVTPVPPTGHQQPYGYQHSPSQQHVQPHGSPSQPHTRGAAFTHPQPAPSSNQVRTSPQYSVAPPPPPAPQAVHPSYSAVPPPPPPQPHHAPSHQAFASSPPYTHDPYARHESDRFGVQERHTDRDRELGREAYPSPSPSRDGYSRPPGSGEGYSEGYTGGSTYLAASERRRAGKHTRRVVKA